MGGPLSGRFADIFMNKLERDVVVPRNPVLYCRFVDDIYKRREKGVPDGMFSALNSYHRNLNFTAEENPDHFLDSDIFEENNEIKTKVHVKPNKIPVFWSSKVPKRYKRNAINGELHRAKRISSDFEQEVTRIRKKFMDVGFPQRYVDSVIRDFQSPPTNADDDIIPDWLFDERQTLVIRLPFCPKNEEMSKTFVQKLETFTKGKFVFKIIWNTRNIRSLFWQKDNLITKVCHSSKS